MVKPSLSATISSPKQGVNGGVRRVKRKTGADSSYTLTLSTDLTFYPDYMYTRKRRDRFSSAVSIIMIRIRGPGQSQSVT